MRHYGPKYPIQGGCPRENVGVKETPEKGRPPPGGEEAEVVVYQPRGVGLIHTRP
jgi:hypothetical protein